MNTWIIGMSERARQSFMLHEIKRDLDDGNSFVLLDPSGDLSAAVSSLCPKRRTSEVLILNPTDDESPSWNVFESVRNKPLLAEKLTQAIVTLAGYRDIPTPVLERLLYNSIHSLLHRKGATILDIEWLLTDKDFRERVLEDVTDEYLRKKWAYWSTLPEKEWRQLISSTENKGGDFAEDPRIRRVLGNPSSFDLERHLFDGKAVILSLPETRLGKKARLLGSLFLAYLMSMERGTVPPVNVYIHDAHVFAEPIVADLLAHFPTTVSNSYLGQLAPALQGAFEGRCETKVMFRVGLRDAEYLHKSIPKNNVDPHFDKLAEFEAVISVGDHADVYQIAEEPSGSEIRARKVAEQSRERYGCRA